MINNGGENQHIRIANAKKFSFAITLINNIV